MKNFFRPVALGIGAAGLLVLGAAWWDSLRRESAVVFTDGTRLHEAASRGGTLGYTGFFEEKAFPETPGDGWASMSYAAWNARVDFRESGKRWSASRMKAAGGGKVFPKPRVARGLGSLRVAVPYWGIAAGWLGLGAMGVAWGRKGRVRGGS